MLKECISVISYDNLAAYLKYFFSDVDASLSSSSPWALIPLSSSFFVAQDYCELT